MIFVAFSVDLPRSYQLKMASDGRSQPEREESIPYAEHLLGQLAPADVERLKAVGTASK